MEEFSFKDATPEQIKEVGKILSKAQLELTWTGLKFVTLLFLSNLICINIGKVLFIESDPLFLLGFETVTLITNAVVLSRYFTGQMAALNDRFKMKLKEILKK